MNKLIKFIQVFLILSYTFLNIYLMIFNWRVYNLLFEMNYGFGSIRLPIVLIIVLIGMFSVLLIWLTIYIKDLKNKNMEEELLRLKTKKFSNAFQEGEIYLNEKLELLQKKIDQLLNLQKTSETL